MSSRMDKVNRQLKKEIGQIVQTELGDPRIGFVSITQVETSKDLRNARVYFSVLGDESQVAEAAKSLNKAKGTIRHLLGQRIRIRYTPELAFHYDQSLAHGAKIEQALKEIESEHSENTENDSEQ